MAYGNLLDGQSDLVQSIIQTAAQGKTPVSLAIAGFTLGGVTVAKEDLANAAGGYASVQFTLARNGMTAGLIATVSGVIPAAKIQEASTAMAALAENVAFDVQFMQYPSLEADAASVLGFKNGALNLQYMGSTTPEVHPVNGSFRAVFSLASADDVEAKAGTTSLFKK